MTCDNDIIYWAGEVSRYIIVALCVYILRNDDESERRHIPFWIVLFWPAALLAVAAQWFSMTDYKGLKSVLPRTYPTAGQNEIEKSQ